ncbi:hypothetical protein BJ085DRAFT_28073 [Dimargaris cristalligena]|uniref:UV-stimulated scaffold protein A C-terminal domain-containing protein n=1 Tax=Dimargaris cristalligena TaxID=215637 RepID=A0A4P9ZMZ1_9FUNG|nr:hypothetical protein BJ085DRAFT_28073 [Dimargaris cristalligena]|eukprot:RKP34623.1 hypothetical protein BJ085DRAFT_28073 [Dimargaris cristalligena]
MDPPTRQVVSRAIRKLVTSGQDQLDEKEMKAIKVQCKRGDEFVDVVYTLLTGQLNRKHSQARYACAQIIIELFNRSHHFRDRLTHDFPTFLSLTLGVYRQELPPPTSYAGKMKVLVVRALQLWVTKYGSHYRAIPLGLDYVKQKLHVRAQFEATAENVVTHAEEQQRQAALAKRREHDLQCFIRLRNTVEPLLVDCEQTAQEMNSGLELLVPDVTGPAPIRRSTGSGRRDQASSSSSSPLAPSLSYKDTMAYLGMGSSNYQLTLTFNPNNPLNVTESAENTVIFDTLREGLKVIDEKYWSTLTASIVELSKLQVESEKEALDQLIKRMINEKSRLRVLRQKCAELNVTVPSNEGDEPEPLAAVPSVTPMSPQPESPGQSDAPSTVANKAGPDSNADTTFSPKSYRHTPSPARVKPKPTTDKVNHDPQSTGSHLSEVEKELLKIAPVVEYGTDLYYWDKDEVAFNQGGIEYNHRFYGEGGGEKFLSRETLDQLRKRAVYLTPKRPTAIKACRAPLKTGGLCPRRDLVRCPYHGPIVPRDETTGHIVDPHVPGDQKGKKPAVPDGGDGSAESGEQQPDTFEELLTGPPPALHPVDPSSHSFPPASNYSSLAHSETRPLEIETSRYAWEEIEDEVNAALGLDRGQFPTGSKRKGHHQA